MRLLQATLLLRPAGNRAPETTLRICANPFSADRLLDERSMRLNTSVEQAIEVLDRVRMEFSTVSHQSEVNGEEFHATFSAGISGYPNYEHSDDIQMSADKALYAAKESGRNCILLAD